MVNTVSLGINFSQFRSISRHLCLLQLILYLMILVPKDSKQGVLYSYETVNFSEPQIATALIWTKHSSPVGFLIGWSFVNLNPTHSSGLIIALISKIDVFKFKNFPKIIDSRVWRVSEWTQYLFYTERGVLKTHQ